MKKNNFLVLGMLVLVIGFSITACRGEDGNGEYSFYGEMFNEASKNAVRERNRSARIAYVPDYELNALDLPNAIDANIVDLFALFELNDKWTYIDKDKPINPPYLVEDNIYDDKDEYPWYVNHREEWGNGEWGDKRKFWIDYHITADRRVVEEFHTRIMNKVYGEPFPWAEGDLEEYKIWFTITKHLDSKAFEIIIGHRYGDKGISSSNITLQDVDDIILEF